MRHKSIISIFTAFFLGIVIATSFVFIFLPFHDAFSLQSSVLRGLASSPETDFLRIFLNNTQVMVLMFLFSVIMGAGAIFILAWNASVIAVYVGFVINNFIRDGISPQLAYVLGVPLGLGSIALHGIPEIGAYFVAALAGGMLSVGIIREKLKGYFKKIFADSLLFLALAEVLIVIAALLEAYV